MEYSAGATVVERVECAAIVISGSAELIGGLNLKVVFCAGSQARKDYIMGGAVAADICGRAQSDGVAVVHPTIAGGIGDSS